MRLTFSNWLTLSFAAPLIIIAGLPLHPAIGQSSGTGDGVREAPQSYSIDFRRAEFVISDVAQVPAQIAQAADEARCDYKLGIKDFPLHFVRAEGRRLVLAFCAGTSVTHQVFDLAELRRPKRVSFPFLAQNVGIGATYRPGVITWRKDAGVFEALSGTDICPHSRLRHIYRLGSTEGAVSGEPSFVLIRVDVMEDACGNNDGPWSTVWEAPKWPKSTIVR